MGWPLSVSRSYCDTKLDLASSDNNIPLSSFEQQQNAKTSDYANTTAAANLLLGDSAYRIKWNFAIRPKVDFIHFVFCFLVIAAHSKHIPDVYHPVQHQPTVI